MFIQRPHCAGGENAACGKQLMRFQSEPSNFKCLGRSVNKALVAKAYD